MYQGGGYAGCDYRNGGYSNGGSSWNGYASGSAGMSWGVGSGGQRGYGGQSSGYDSNSRGYQNGGDYGGSSSSKRRSDSRDTRDGGGTSSSSRYGYREVSTHAERVHDRRWSDLLEVKIRCMVDESPDEEEMFLPMCIRSWPGKKTGE
jgi:hypothetical protein